MDTPEIERIVRAAYDEHADAIFRYCHTRISNRELAKELMQETFMRTFRYLSGGRAILHMKPFLYKTAKNLTIDWYAKKTSEPISLEILIETGVHLYDTETEDPEEHAEKNEAIRAIHELPPNYREVLLLRYVEGLTLKEIASALDVRETTVAVRIHRGIRHLRKILT